MINLLRRLFADRRGLSSIVFAGSSMVLFGFGAIAVDGGSFYYQKRRQQTATDLAALAAAADLGRADAAARSSAGRNGYTAAAVERVQLGTYSANATLAPEMRFQPGSAAGANAARIEMRATTPMILGRVIGAGGLGNDAGEVAILTRATAAQDMQAAFAVGSRLARVEGGALNGLLGGLLGTSLSLSVMDYEGLARARIDLFGFARQLATRASISALTFDEVVRAQVRIGDVILAAQDAARAQGAGSDAIAALGRLASVLAGSGQRINLQSLVSFGTYGSRQLSEELPIKASLAALDLVSATAQIANGARQLDLGLAVNVPGLASVSLKLGIGERPVGTSLVRVGRNGATVHTAQTRLLLTLTLVGSGQASLVKLPLYLELASATARLTSISCGAGDITSARVTLGVTPAVVDAWIGQVSNAEFSNFSTRPNPPAATLLDLLLVKVTGRAHVTISNTSETPVSFSYAEIQRAEKKTTSTQNFVASLLSRLVSDLEVRVEPLGLGLGIGGAVSGVIAGAAAPLDQVLTSLLNTLGIGLGQADSWVTGVRCGGAVLIQ
ncbi:pilus assembly protein TadG-related protein [Bosea vestrisii]|uniref:pilus assembly protein TadG-related protein n=1 Tax=Bosea vestrisii TaxID=151416 RepID=UPI0024DFE859|nr:pilus assembly protein TadG-related protein [Bosea vestrisii]WID95374.1 pilus assembly protein TadG-related protein [Bosea vestrisii]